MSPLFERRQIRPRRDGSYAVDLPEHERDLLVSLAAQLRALIDQGDDDPSLARLFPTAYVDRPDLDDEFHRLMHDDLAARHRWALTVMGETAHEPSLNADQLGAWMEGLNQLRLVLGTRLDVQEEMAPVEPSHPDAQPLAVYHYLSWLLEQVVDAMHSTLPDPR